MPMSEERKQYLYTYAKEKLKRVPLNLPKDYFDTRLKPAADAANESINGYIKKAIDMRIDSENQKAE